MPAAAGARLSYHFKMEPEFDREAALYRAKIERSISFAGASHDFFTWVKAQAIVSLIQRRLGDPAKARILDVGCGVGSTDAYLTPSVGEVHGVDVSPKSIELAAQANPQARYLTYDGTRLPYEDGHFDLVFAICVMHHVPPKDWRAFVAEMRRVTQPGGIVAVFEHNPWNPLTRIVVNRCEFDKDAVLLTLGKVAELFSNESILPIEKKYILFTPFQAPLIRRLDGMMGWLPLGAQYYLAGKKE